MTDHANDKRSPIIGGALFLTAFFLGVFGWLLSRTNTCPDGWWLWHRLDCLEPNALGDTFAGAFAPVAFVWLVAAVLLQRSELAAQRQELRESRKVAMQQVEESRKNVEYIGEQTGILRDQRDEAVAQSATTSRVKALFTAIDSFEGLIAKIGLTHLGALLTPFSLVKDSDNFRQLAAYLTQLTEFAGRAIAINGDNGPLEMHDRRQLLLLREDLVRLKELMVPAEGNVDAQLLSEAQLDHAISAAEFLHALNNPVSPFWDDPFPEWRSSPANDDHDF